MSMSVVVSLSDPRDLSKGTRERKDSVWHVPWREGPVDDDDFEGWTRWYGEYFVRLVDDVFMFHGWIQEGRI